MKNRTSNQTGGPATPAWHWLVPACLSLALVIQATSSMAGKSVTIDEIMYIAAGYHHLHTGDFSFNQTNPPLMKMVSAAPLRLLGLRPPKVEQVDGQSKQVRDWHASRQFMYENTVSADRILFIARLPIVAISVMLGLLVWRWTFEIYGPSAAALAQCLYCFSPNILAHSRLATQDLGLAAVVFAALFCFWKYLSHSRIMYLLASSFLIGCGLTIKTPVILALGGMGIYGVFKFLQNKDAFLHPWLPFVGRASTLHPRLGQLVSLAMICVLFAVVAIGSVNLVYGFQDVYLANVKGVPCPLPAAFAQALRFQDGLKNAPSSVYFAGSYYSPGLWYKHVVAFFIKTPLPSLILIGLACGFLVRRRRWDSEWLLLGTAAVFVVAFSFLSNIGGSLRYILAVYPLLFTIAGALLADYWRPNRLRLATIGGLVACYLLASVSIYPHYLANFNSLVGGPSQGYRWLSDSDLDWGQDLKSLGDYLRANSIEKIHLAYFGSADARYYGIDYDYLPSVGLAPREGDEQWWYESREQAFERPQGKLAISATLLTAGRNWMSPFREQYAWLRHEEPIDKVGHSILIYDIH